MSIRITKSAIRNFAFNLRIEGMDACMKAADVNGNVEPRKWAALRERGESFRRIANQLDALIDGKTP